MHTSLQPLGECHCWWTRVSPMAHVAKFYGRLQLIRSVSRASTFSVLKFIEIVIFGVYSSSLLASVCFGTFVISLFNFFRYFVWLRITDDGSKIIWARCILLNLRSKTPQRAQLLLLTEIYYCRLGGMVNFTLPSTTNEMISISTSQTFRS